MLHDDGSYEIFMTPEDFVRSLTPGVMQPRRYGLDKFKNYRKGVRIVDQKLLNKHFNFQDPIPYTSKKNIFYWMGRDGLINYTDYLFLMTLLSSKKYIFLEKNNNFLILSLSKRHSFGILRVRHQWRRKFGQRRI